jgi:hypothetical protein
MWRFDSHRTLPRNSMPSCWWQLPVRKVPQLGRRQTEQQGRNDRGEHAKGMKTRSLRSLGIFLLYGAITILLTYPIAFEIAHKLPQHGVDIWEALWNDWWFRQAVFTGQNLYFTPMLFYPQGTSLATHANSPLFSAISASLFPLRGGLAAYNISTLMIFPLGAFGMYLLAHDLTKRPAASFVAGLVYAFAPYHLTQAIHVPHLGSVHWMPYMSFFLRRAIHGGRWMDALGTGVFFSLSVWSGLHLGFLGGLWAAVFVTWTMFSDREARQRTSWSALLMAALVALFLSIPAVIPALRGWRLVPDPDTVLVQERTRGQTDLLAYLTPPRYHPVLGQFAQPLYSNFEKNHQWMPYLGVVPLSLAMYASLKDRRAARFWWASGLLWMLLALGACPRINGHVYSSITLPYGLLDQHFPFNTVRSSDRFNLLVPLSLASLVGIALAHTKRRWVIPLVGGLIVFEYLCVPIPMQAPPSLSPFVLQMAADPQQYAIVDVPMGVTASKHWMYMQTAHGKPLVAAAISRTPPEAYAFITSVPLLRAFRDPEYPPPGNISADLCVLAETRVRYILIHLDFASEEDVQRWVSWFPEAPVYRDDRLIVYSTDSSCIPL